MRIPSRHIDPAKSSFKLRDDRKPYLHGGGFGVATEILAYPEWAELFKTLEPNRFKQCDRILEQHNRVLNTASARKITKVLENSPVISALARFKIGRAIPIEWDLWLHPKDPSSLDLALIEHGSISELLLSKLPFKQSYALKSTHSVAWWNDTYKLALKKCNISENPSVCLDIKSPWSTAQDINLFILALKKSCQIEVRYVGSFVYQQIEKINGPEKILFCHAVWDLEKKVKSGHFPEILMLNGADLNDQNLKALGNIVDKNLVKIGIYLQEESAETKEVQKLITLVNNNPDLIEFGFALGNSEDGRAMREFRGSGAGAQTILLTKNVRLIKRISLVCLLALSFYVCKRYLA